MKKCFLNPCILIIFFSVLTLVLIVVLACCENVRRTFPMNLIFLGLFVSFLCLFGVKNKHLWFCATFLLPIELIDFVLVHLFILSEVLLQKHYFVFNYECLLIHFCYDKLNTYQLISGVFLCISDSLWILATWVCSKVSHKNWLNNNMVITIIIMWLNIKIMYYNPFSFSLIVKE